MGHADIAHTYWYLQATPELMTDIAAAAEALMQHQDHIRSGWTRQESREGRAERERWRCQEFAANLPAKRVHKKRRKKKTRR